VAKVSHTGCWRKTAAKASHILLEKNCGKSVTYCWTAAKALHILLEKNCGKNVTYCWRKTVAKALKILLEKNCGKSVTYCWRKTAAKALHILLEKHCGKSVTNSWRKTAIKALHILLEKQSIFLDKSTLSNDIVTFLPYFWNNWTYPLWICPLAESNVIVTSLPLLQ